MRYSMKDLKYRILSHITFGAKKNHYKNKWHKIKTTAYEKSLEYQVELLKKQTNNLQNLLKEFKSSSMANLWLLRTDIELNKQPLLHRIDADINIEKYKQQMIDLKLFDEEFYTTTYPEYKKYGLSPLEHYINLGWQMRFNPSKEFDTTKYLAQKVGLTECPLIHFLREGRYLAKYAYTSNPYPLSDTRIKENNKKVVYTCVVGEYDELQQQSYIAEDYDYICFTDNKEWIKQEKIGHWQIKPLKFEGLDNTRINRYHKLNPHIVLPEYEESIYIDANIIILTPFLFDLITARNQNLILPRHFDDICPYAHSTWILKDKVDYPELINGFLDLMRKNGFPKNYGMTENNIIYRKHNDPKIIAIMEEWWSYIRDYCKRDQLSFSYVLWKHGISVDDICFSNARNDLNNFIMIKHDKRRPDVE